MWCAFGGGVGGVGGVVPTLGVAKVQGWAEAGCVHFARNLFRIQIF